MTRRVTDTPSRDDFISTGSTLLNLACTGNWSRGFQKGYYYFLVGDSSSGKTFLTLTCLAEAARKKSFEGYRFIYDNSEGGAHMGIQHFFGSGVAERLEPPKEEDGEPIYSSTIEEFYYHLDDALGQETPFIYILDSMDSLSSAYEHEKFEEHKTAHQKNKQTAGSYGDGKAKINSSNIRRILTPLKESGSILIVINQTRDNLGFGFEKKTRSGGHALKFYATIEMWSSVKGRIKKTVKGKPRQIGTNCAVTVKKNRFTGRERTINLPIYFSYGIDDVGACVDFLVDEKHWTKKGSKISVPEFASGFESATRDKVIAHIEETKQQKKLRRIVQAVWNEIDEGCSLKREPRYD